MANQNLLRANVGGLRYVWTLVAAYRRFIWIIDPDFATQNEPEAWTRVRRDADIAHAMMKRRQAVAGLNWIFIPPTDATQDKLAAEIMTFLFDHIRRFHWARYNLAEAIFRGSSYTYINGQRLSKQMAGDSTSRLFWVPLELKHIDRFRFRITRTDEPEDDIIKTTWELFSIKRQKWEKLTHTKNFVRHNFEQTEDTLGYGRGLLQSIYFWWRAKEILFSQGLAGVERWAQGLLEVGVDGLRPGSAERNNEAIVDEWIEELQKHRSEHVLIHDKRDEVKVHDWPATGAQQVNMMMQMIQNSLDRLILSSKLPTGGGGETGSLARASVEEGQMEATFEADRLALSESLDVSLGKMVWNRNFETIRVIASERGLPTPNRPRYQIMQRKVNNPELNARIIQIALGSGIPIKTQQAYELLEFEQPADDDDVIVGRPGLPIGGNTQLPELPFTSKVMKMREWKKDNNLDKTDLKFPKRIINAS